MNSIPQHDVANGNGQMEFFLAIPTTLSKLVAKNPAPSYPGGFSPTDTLVSTMPFYCQLALCTFAFLPTANSAFKFRAYGCPLPFASCPLTATPT
jgi:hypothetical protein